MNKKEDKELFLKVDGVEPVFKGGGTWPGEPYLDGIKVWINGDGHFFPCDRWTVCNPDEVREEGRRQAMTLAIELYDTSYADKCDLFEASTVKDIFLKFPYEAIKEKIDAWKKEKEKIRVRDEVTTGDITFVVTKVYTYYVDGLSKGGGVFRGILSNNIRKTGRHVDDLDSYLEA